MQTTSETPAEPMSPEVEAARVEMHRLIDEAFKADSVTRVVMHAADADGITAHVVGLSAAEYAQVMEATYARYQERCYRSTPEVLQ